jgi:hypothetical protein
MEIEIQMVIINELGVFEGRKTIVSEEVYHNVINISKKFYNGNAGFDLTCEDNFIVFPPDIVQKSILRINKRIIE